MKRRFYMIREWLRYRVRQMRVYLGLYSNEYLVQRAVDRWLFKKYAESVIRDLFEATHDRFINEDAVRRTFADDAISKLLVAYIQVIVETEFNDSIFAPTEQLY